MSLRLLPSTQAAADAHEHRLAHVLAVGQQHPTSPLWRLRQTPRN
jgi:hypothetical protein